MTTNTIKLAVHGAAGRMGRRVVALASEDTEFQIVAAIDHAGNPLLGQDAGAVAGFAPIGVPLATDWPEEVDVVIDFSLPKALDHCIESCVESSTPLVVATTGLSDEQKVKLQAAAELIPIVWAPSMSLAVNLTMKLAEQVADTLGDVVGGLDVEIIERHHRFKADAPSGTALKFGELIAKQLSDDTLHVHGREGHTGERTRNEIGYHAVRVGDNPGEHTIVFGMLGEKIELNVAASNRDCYASGALAAAKWLQGRPKGLYNMFDVLGLQSS
ncbi:4-hydroxy-tetrahydrodipicolinate reductase [Novipirellula galeiformis]|nr:4-hydroxy-tetrahydrodipicolinate reductase [Novipirellula galeiformis]